MKPLTAAVALAAITACAAQPSPSSQQPGAERLSEAEIYAALFGTTKEQCEARTTQAGYPSTTCGCIVHGVQERWAPESLAAPVTTAAGADELETGMTRILEQCGVETR
jgi:hypothetical protein